MPGVELKISGLNLSRSAYRVATRAAESESLKNKPTQTVFVRQFEAKLNQLYVT